MKKNDATNYPIQGSAFHCLLWSFIELDRIQREEKWDSRLIGQIHDAIVLDIEPSEMEHVMKTVKRVTCVDLPRKWPWIIVPLDVEAEVCEVDRPWNTKKAYKIVS
jgi:DNA polymerase I-like protein with 3'-5' exonuclease and polymerase domains